MLIDIKYIQTKYNFSNEQFLDIFKIPHFERHIETYNKKFNMEYYNKTYLYNFTDYDEAYINWITKRDLGYKGYEHEENGIIYNSQINQDYIVINDLFKKCFGGTFVEFGASDGIFLSNTLTLEKYFNWTGLLIECNDESYAELIKNRPKSKCVNEVIYDCDDEEIDFINGDNNELSGMINEKSITKRKTKTLERILDENKMPKIIHYMSVDIEGAEYKALVNFPFNNKYTVYCLTIEHGFNNENKLRIRELMTTNGYQLYRENLWDDIFVLGELLTKKIVNSFDIFDTLVHRYYYYDNSIIKKIADEIKDKTFYQNRKQQENNSKSLEEIYNNIFTDSETDAKLYYNKELTLEIDNLFINNTNLKKVKSTDILVSDIYYSYDELAKILEKFNIKNTYYCSKDGKRSGWIYKQLLEEYIIVSHFGDNSYSDGVMALKNDINAICDNFGMFNNFESELIKNNFFNIACLLRKTRISLSFDIMSEQIIIGELTFIINLIIYILIIKNYSEYDNYLLSMRDCCHLFNFFKTFNKDKQYVKLYTSRKAYANNSLHFINYFRESVRFHKNLLVDMNGTGTSVLTFLNTHNISTVDILYIFKFNNQNINFIINDKEFVDILEIINYDYNGKCIDYCGGPIFEKVDYDISKILQIHNFVNFTLNNCTNIQDEILNTFASTSSDNLIQLLKNYLMLYKYSPYYKNIKHNTN